MKHPNPLKIYRASLYALPHLLVSFILNAPGLLVLYAGLTYYRITFENDMTRDFLTGSILGILEIIMTIMVMARTFDIYYHSRDRHLNYLGLRWKKTEKRLLLMCMRLFISLVAIYFFLNVLGVNTLSKAFSNQAEGSMMEMFLAYYNQTLTFHRDLLSSFLVFLLTIAIIVKTSLSFVLCYKNTASPLRGSFKMTSGHGVRILMVFFLLDTTISVTGIGIDSLAKLMSNTSLSVYFSEISRSIIQVIYMIIGTYSTATLYNLIQKERDPT